MNRLLSTSRLVAGLVTLALVPSFASGQSLRLVPQVGHTDVINSASYSPDGKQIVTTSHDKTAKIWDASTGKELLTYRGHRDMVFSATFSPDGTKVLSSAFVEETKLWDAKSGEDLLTLRGMAAAFSPDGARIVTVLEDGSSIVWNAATGKEIYKLGTRASNTFYYNPTYSQDGRFIAFVAEENKVRIVSVQGGRDVLVLSGHSDFIYDVSYSQDGTRLVTASEDQTVKVWDAKSGAILLSIDAHERSISTVRFSPDGSKVVSASKDRTAIIWDAKTGQKLLTITGHDNDLQSAEFSPDGRHVLTSSWDYTARTWDASNGEQVQLFEGVGLRYVGATYSLDGKSILVGIEGNSSVALDLITGEVQVVVDGDRGIYSPDGKTFLTLLWDKTAKLWDTVTGKERFVLRGHEELVLRAAFSFDGQRIVTAGGDHTCRIWDARTGTELLKFKGHSGEVLTAQFSPDGGQVVTASGDTTAGIWDATTGREIHSLVGHTMPVWTASFSPDGRRVVTGSMDKSARIWDVKSGRSLSQLLGHRSYIEDAIFTRDSQRVITTSEDGTAKIWEVASGRELATLTGHSDAVVSVAISPDEKVLMTASEDGSIRFWNAPTGSEMYCRHMFTDGSWIILAPDGRYDSSEGANPKYGHFVIDTPDGPEAIGFDQIDPTEFYYEGLAEAIMSGKYVPGTRPLFEEKVYPKVTQNLQGSRLTFTATDRGGGIGDVWILLNQTRKKVLGNGSVKSGVPVTIDLTELGFTPGQSVDVQAHNSTNRLRSPLTSKYDWARGGNETEDRQQLVKDDKTPSRFIAVLMGSEGYSGGSLKALDFAGDDVIELAKALHAMVLAKPEITVITDDPTAEERLKGLAGITVVRGASKANWTQVMSQYQDHDFTFNDWLFLAFSGHGAVHQSRFFYLTAEATASTTESATDPIWVNRTISALEIEAQLSKASASNKSLILDTCGAGTAVADPTFRSQTVSIEATIANLSYGNQGTHILLATQAEEKAFEDPDLKHGFLTYSLLKVLKSGTDVVPGKESAVTGKSWFEEAITVCADVAAKRGKAQVPRTHIVRDFALGSLSDDQRLAIAIPELLPGIHACRIQNQTSLPVAWLNNGVMAAVQPGGKGAQFVAAAKDVGTDVYVILGNYQEQGDAITIIIRLYQKTPQGREAVSPEMVISTTREKAVEEILKAAAKLRSEREKWPSN